MLLLVCVASTVSPLKCDVFKRFCVVALLVGYRVLVRRLVSSLPWCVECCRKVSKASKTPARTYLPLLLRYKDWILLVQGEESLSVLSVGKKKANTCTTAVISSFVFGLVQVDREGIVRIIDDDDAVFIYGRDGVVRYHGSGITVSRMDDTGELLSTCAGGVRDGSSDMEEPMGCILSEYEVGLLVLYIRAGDVFSL